MSAAGGVSGKSWCVAVWCVVRWREAKCSRGRSWSVSVEAWEGVGVCVASMKVLCRSVNSWRICLIVNSSIPRDRGIERWERSYFTMA